MLNLRVVFNIFFHSLYFEKNTKQFNMFPGLLAGLSGIRAGWVLETKSRLGAE